MKTITEILEGAKRADKFIATLTAEQIDAFLNELSDEILQEKSAILAANAEDLARMEPSDPKYDRLKLTESRLNDIASDMKNVASLPSPLHKVLGEWTRPNGMVIRKVSVPFGVIGVIYEARPNVTFDVFSLCLKAGSACVLKGGSDAQNTNTAVVGIIKQSLERHGLEPNVVSLLPSGHESALELLHATNHVDLIIPRGSRRLIEFVRENSRVPMIETGAGVCHTYIHSSADIHSAAAIVFNAKTRRPSVCNTLDTIIVDRAIVHRLPEICNMLASRSVSIHADKWAYRALEGHYPILTLATDADFGVEWLDYKLSIATVDGLQEALDFIDRYGSHHSECIVAKDENAISRFLNAVDAACVYANASTSFTDGAQFGFGAEIGISTQRLHARGPMGLPEITTYKYVVIGTGNTRW
jgi:glutamate-5-semialdehyde dehydrogenase